MRLRKWKWGFIVALLAVILLHNPLGHLYFSVRLALSVQKLASGAGEQDLAVQQAKIHHRQGMQDYAALVYRPTKSTATSAIIIVPGISELGCYHPRLVALSRLLAENGLLVVTPDIRQFRDFQISAEPIDQILFWYGRVSTLEGGEKVQKTGLAGISFSGTLVLMAAARPEIRDQVGFVVAIGPYCDLLRCAKDWFAVGTATAGNGYPTRFYAKWILMLAGLNMVKETRDRLFLQGVLDNLLLQKAVPPADPGLTAEGLRWYRLATMPAGQSDPELAQEIEKHLTARIYTELDPDDSLNRLRCPVFLIHGAYDDLIPYGESVELHRRIVHSYLLVSPLLTHTHPTDTPLTFTQKARALFDTVFFCYRFSRAINP